MSNPFTRLIGQAEVNIAELGRRTAASIAEPLKAKGQEVVAEVVGSAAVAIRAIVVKAVLGLFAGVMLIIAACYAVTALYAELLPRLGPVEARVVIAGVFAGVAVIALLGIMFWPKGTKGAKQATKQMGAPAKAQMKAAKAETAAAIDDARRAMAHEAASLDAATPAPADLKGGVEALASILGDAGYRREQAGLRAGLALASQLKPMQIVALALIGGYVAGVRYTGRR